MPPSDDRTDDVMLGLTEAVEAVAAGQTSMVLKLDSLAQAQLANAIWREYYGPKIDQVWKVLYDNGFIAQVKVMQNRMDNLEESARDRREADRERTDLKVQSVKETSIDWKWLASTFLGPAAAIATGVVVYYLTRGG